MSKILIDMVTGTVLNYDDKVVVVDTKTVGDDGKQLLEDWNVTGSDNTIIELGTLYGKPITSVPTDMTYTNSISFAPSALREEAESIASQTAGASEHEDVLNWVIDTATDDQLNHIAQYIMQDDALWANYLPSVVDGLIWGHSIYTSKEPF